MGNKPSVPIATPEYAQELYGYYKNQRNDKYAAKLLNDLKFKDNQIATAIQNTSYKKGVELPGNCKVEIKDGQNRVITNIPTTDDWKFDCALSDEEKNKINRLNRLRMASHPQVGSSHKIHILGRLRVIKKVGRISFVTYQKQWIKLSDARILDKQLNMQIKKQKKNK